MELYDLLDSSVIENIPSYKRLDKRLKEEEFRSTMKKFLRNRGLEDIITCNNSYILYNGESGVFECISKNNHVYYYPSRYNTDSIYRKIAQIDFAIIDDKNKSVYIFEHKTGRGGPFDEASIQVIRYLVLVSYIISKPVVGYVYLGKTGDLFRTAAIVNKYGKYYLILFRYNPFKFSEIIQLSEIAIGKIINSNRKDAENIIRKLIFIIDYIEQLSRTYK